MSSAGGDRSASTRKRRREQARAERRAKEALARREAQRRKRIRWVSAAAIAAASLAVIAALAAIGGGSSGLSSPSAPALRVASLAPLGPLRPPGSAGAPGPEGIPIPNGPTLAGTGSIASGNQVDGIQCLGNEQTLFHIHAHLTVFVNGTPRQIPYGVGITNPQLQNTPEGSFVGSGGCFYWLHTHAADGIIHIESPVQRTFTLGDFFDIWGQPLSPTQVGPARGRVTAMYNAQRYLGDPRDIPLEAHAQIQLEVGRPLVAPVTISFANGL